MLTRRIIPCLDVDNGRVVKGVRFAGHEIVGDMVPLALRYRDAGADELVLYDITASSQRRTVDPRWVNAVARQLDIPFCVAGGIRTVEDARRILHAGADKISINSPALERPELITELAESFGSQCIVVGIDSQPGTAQHSGDDGVAAAEHWIVYQYTGSAATMRATTRRTLDWAAEAQSRGAGELVLNCMAQDGTRQGFACAHLEAVRARVTIPLVASGGAGTPHHFVELFAQTDVSAALAAGVFHRGEIAIDQLKQYLDAHNICVRL